MKRKADDDSLTTPKRARTTPPPDLDSKMVLRAAPQPKAALGMEARSLLSCAGATLLIYSRFGNGVVRAHLTSTLHSGLDSLMCRLENMNQLESMRRHRLFRDQDLTTSYKSLFWHDPERRGLKLYGSKHNVITVKILAADDQGQTDGEVDIRWSFGVNAQSILQRVLAERAWFPGPLQRLICSFAEVSCFADSIL